MSSYKLFRVLVSGVLLATFAVLTACGFRLQGSNDYPEAMANTFIDTDDRYTPFYRDLSIALEQGGINLKTSPIDADSVIQIHQDETDQRVLTITGRNVPEEYEVYYRISYSVYVNGEKKIANRRLRREQDYTFDSTLKLGKDREAEGFVEALSRDLVKQVTYQLSQIR